MNESRYDRQEQFFGAEGQKKISETKVTVIGLGGIGGHIVQQLSLLGVKNLILIESEELSESNRNRYVTARDSDQIPGSHKVDLAIRLINEIDKTINIEKEYDSFISEKAFTKIIGSDYVFGCLDKEGARLILTELCSAYGIKYFDLATEIIPGNPLEYGGRIHFNNGSGCMVCQNVLDMNEAGQDLMPPINRADRDNLYGVKKESLEKSGPSVVSINGVIASLAVTEFIVSASGLRSPKNYINYRGSRGIVTLVNEQADPDCYICAGIRNKYNAADIQKYIRMGVGNYL